MRAILARGTLTEPGKDSPYRTRGADDKRDHAFPPASVMPTAFAFSSPLVTTPAEVGPVPGNKPVAASTAGASPAPVPVDPAIALKARADRAFESARARRVWLRKALMTVLPPVVGFGLLLLVWELLTLKSTSFPGPGATWQAAVELFPIRHVCGFGNDLLPIILSGTVQEQVNKGIEILTDQAVKSVDGLNSVGVQLDRLNQVKNEALDQVKHVPVLGPLAQEILDSIK